MSIAGHELSRAASVPLKRKRKREARLASTRDAREQLKRSYAAVGAGFNAANNGLSGACGTSKLHLREARVYARTANGFGDERLGPFGFEMNPDLGVF
jgi:hypothetical protein